MSIQIRCPGCGKGFAVDDRFAGKKGRCKQCGGVLTVPAATATPYVENVIPVAQMPPMPPPIPQYTPPAHNPPPIGYHAMPIDVREIASRQRGLLACILGYVIAVCLQLAIPAEMRPLLGMGVLALGVIAAVFVFMMAIKLHGTGLGIVLGILTLIPLLGLIPLLIVNGKATRVLKEHGIHVGLLGADISQL